MNERFSDLRVLRWTDRIEGILAGERRGPIRANLDLTNLCNHACPWCEPLAFREATIENTNHTLQTATAIEVLEDLADLGTKAVYFSGGGEPLLHRDFGTLLRFASRHKMRTWVVTNGSFIDKWAGDLVLYANHIRVSLDAATPAQHEAMHGRAGEFKNVMHNIEMLAKVREGKTTPEIGVAYILAASNSDTDAIADLVEELDEIGVDFIHFRPLSEQEGQHFASEHPLETMKWIEDNIHPKWLKIYCLGKRQQDVFTRRDFKKCYAALTLSVISANGDVVACCDERTKVFGNVNEQSFKSIWLSAYHRMKAEKIVPQFCHRCLMCSYNSAVEKFVVNNGAFPELL